jgi:hypothetical protein
MFGFANAWQWILFIIVFAIACIIGGYRARGLDSPKKELSLLGSAINLFGVVALFVYVTQPFFFHYSYIPDELKTLQDARRTVTDLDSHLVTLNENLQNLKEGMNLLLGAFCFVVLPAIFSFARALVPAHLDGDPEEMISIFDTNKE